MDNTLKFHHILALAALVVSIVSPAGYAHAARSVAPPPAVADRELSAIPEPAAPAQTAKAAAKAAIEANGNPDAPAGEECTLKGMVFCTEYGTRFKEPLTLVTDGGHAAEVSMDDGTFEISLPCPGTYPLRIEFAGKGFEAGTLTLPECPTESGAVLEIHYSGSMLEIVREARAGNEDVSVSLVLKQP